MTLKDPLLEEGRAGRPPIHLWFIFILFFGLGSRGERARKATERSPSSSAIQPPAVSVAIGSVN